MRCVGNIADPKTPDVTLVKPQTPTPRNVILKNSGSPKTAMSLSCNPAFRVPAPALTVQEAFAEQVQRIESLARHLDAAAAKADAMAAGLSAEVFDQSPHKGNGHAGAQAGQ